MRKKYIVSTFGFALLVGLVSSCNLKDKQEGHADPGVVKSTLPVIKAQYGTRIMTAEVQGIINYDTRNEKSIASRVSGRIERLLIKYNYQPVRKGQLIMEVYAPDLAAAQQELLFLQHSENDQLLFDRAKQRLVLLGMTNTSINQVLRTKKVNYRIPVYSPVDGYILVKSTAPSTNTPSAAITASGGDGMSGMSGGTATIAAPIASVALSSPILLREGQYVAAGQSIFTIYTSSSLIAEFSLKPDLAARIKKGDKFVFYKTADKSSAEQASIGMIQPVLKNGENFTIARTYLRSSKFRVGELLTAKIPVLLFASWWLPESAIATLGNQKVLFKKEGNVVRPQAIKTGITLAGMIQITEDISEWEVSKNAAYLVDSESFIKK